MILSTLFFEEPNSPGFSENSLIDFTISGTLSKSTKLFLNTPESARRPDPSRQLSQGCHYSFVLSVQVKLGPPFGQLRMSTVRHLYQRGAVIKLLGFAMLAFNSDNTYTKRT